MPKLKIIFFLWLWAPLAVAESPAKALVQALKMAEVVPQQSLQHIDYSVGKISCHTADAYTDGLTVYDCRLDDRRTIKGASAKILYEALLQFKLPVDAGMSQTRLEAAQVFCRIKLKQIPVRYHCRCLSNKSDSLN